MKARQPMTTDPDRWYILTDPELPQAYYMVLLQRCEKKQHPSMMLTSFTFHLWVSQMRAMKVTPRALADDLTVVAFGPNHERRFRDAFAATMQYLKALGAKPAPSKCFTFSSLKDTRTRLEDFYWQDLQAKTKVITDCRDLGAHLSVTARLKGATLTSRIARAN